MTRMIEYDGQQMSISDWSRTTGISRFAITKRLKKGLPLKYVFWNGNLGSVTVNYKGKLRYIRDLAQEHNFDTDLLRVRIQQGWSVDDALSTPKWSKPDRNLKYGIRLTDDPKAYSHARHKYEWENNPQYKQGMLDSMKRWQSDPNNYALMRKSAGKRNKKLYHNDPVYQLKQKHDAMMYRCFNPKSKVYAYYNPFGVEPYLQDKNCFVYWALQNGFKLGLHLHRQDNTKGYYRDNIEFLTADEHAEAHRHTIFGIGKAA